MTISNIRLASRDNFGIIDRRTFCTLTASSAASMLLPSIVCAQPPRAHNVVLVHGLFADGSSWSKVIVLLQRPASP